MAQTAIPATILPQPDRQLLKSPRGSLALAKIVLLSLPPRTLVQLQIRKATQPRKSIRKAPVYCLNSCEPRCALRSNFSNYSITAKRQTKVLGRISMPPRLASEPCALSENKMPPQSQTGAWKTRHSSEPILLEIDLTQ